MRRPPRSARRAALGAAAAAAVALGVAACGGGATAQDTAVGNGSSFVPGSYGTTVFPPGARPEAPQVRGTTLSGGTFTLSADRGSVVVMNFWGSWCTPCREEAPVLGALARRFSGPACGSSAWTSGTTRPAPRRSCARTGSATRA